MTHTTFGSHITTYEKESSDMTTTNQMQSVTVTVGEKPLVVFQTTDIDKVRRHVTTYGRSLVVAVSMTDGPAIGSTNPQGGYHKRQAKSLMADVKAAMQPLPDYDSLFVADDVRLVEPCITGCGDPVESRNGKAVGCLHGEDCHSIADGCL